MKHLINIAYGIGAGMLCAGFFYLAGLVLTPRRWDEHLRGAGLAILGSALYVLLCWMAISTQGIPLTFVTVAFASSVLVLSILRNRRVVPAVTAGIATESLRTGLWLFASFFVISYVMTRPPVADVFLPPAWSGNPDLVSYARYARHLLIFGSPNLDEASFDYLWSPAATHLLAGFSLLFIQDPLSAAMPARFVLAALIGISIVGTCRSVFSLPMQTAIVIAIIFITNPYFKQVFNAYQLPTFIAVPIFLFLVWLTIRARSMSAIDWGFVVACTGAYTLLFLTDIAALPTAVALQAVLIGTLRASGHNVRGIVLSSVISAAIVALTFVDRVRWAFDNPDVSNALTSIALTLGILLLASVAYLIHREDVLARIARNPIDRRLMVAGAGYAAIALVAGNVAVHAARERVPWRMPGKWRGIEQLKNLHLSQLTLKIEHDPNGLLRSITRYFLPETRVHDIAPVVRLRDLRFETISRRSPILIQNFGCDGVGHADVRTIEGVGCVVFAPPTFELDVQYPFSRTFLFVSFDGMTDREPGGRWNFGRGLSLRLTVDPQRTRVDRDLHVNFFVKPSLRPDMAPQRLPFRWGAARRGEIFVATEEWVSVPVSAADWTANRVRRLPISMAFPEGRTIFFHALTVSEKPSGRLVQ